LTELSNARTAIPVFTPWYAKEKVVAVLHNIHQEDFTNICPSLAFVAAVMENG